MKPTESELRQQVISAVCFKPHVEGHLEQFERIESLIKSKQTEAVNAVLDKAIYQLPNPDNNVEEWKGHNLGLRQAIHVLQSLKNNNKENK